MAWGITGCIRDRRQQPAFRVDHEQQTRGPAAIAGWDGQPPERAQVHRGGGWTHIVGGGGSLLFYDAATGPGLAGTLDQTGWRAVERYTDFSTGWRVVVATAAGSVLMIDPDTGQGAGGTIRDGNLVYANGVSVANPATGEAVTVDSRFRIASVSKTITAAAIMTLVEAGQLSLDDTFFGADGLLGDRYVPNPFAPADADITITHLLQHTAGAWSNAAPDPMFERPEIDVEDLIDWVIDNRLLEDEPGTTFAYSNFGYCLPGRVIEEVSGQPYADYVQAAVLGPCGITSMEIAGNTPGPAAPGRGRVRRRQHTGEPGHALRDPVGPDGRARRLDRHADRPVAVRGPGRWLRDRTRYPARGDGHDDGDAVGREPGRRQSGIRHGLVGERRQQLVARWPAGRHGGVPGAHQRRDLLGGAGQRQRHRPGSHGLGHDRPDRCLAGGRVVAGETR